MPRKLSAGVLITRKIFSRWWLKNETRHENGDEKTSLVKHFLFSEKSNKSENFSNKVRSLNKSSEKAGKSFYENYSWQNKCITTENTSNGLMILSRVIRFLSTRCWITNIFYGTSFLTDFYGFLAFIVSFPAFVPYLHFSGVQTRFAEFLNKFPSNKPQKAFKRASRWFPKEPKFIAVWENIKIRFRENFRFLRLSNNQIKSKTLPSLCLLKRRKEKSIVGWCVKAANQKTNERQNVRKTRRKF